MKRNNLTREHIINLHKTRICFYICDAILAPSLNLLREELVDITYEHMHLALSPIAGFRYRGRNYGKSDHLTPLQLNTELHNRMDTYLNQLSQIEQLESPRIEGYISFVLSKSGNAQVFKALMPDHFHKYMDGLAGAVFTGTFTEIDQRIQDTLVVSHLATIQLIKKRLLMNMISS